MSVVTHHNLEVVTGYDFLSIFHPADRRWGVSCDSTLKLDVCRLVGERVGRIVQELRRHCRNKQINTSHKKQSLRYNPSWVGNLQPDPDQIQLNIQNVSISPPSPSCR